MSGQGEVRALAWTDGACRGNPGPGGHAAVLVLDGVETVITGRAADTTNNRMEMMAAISALDAMPPGTPITVFSDSKLLVDGMTVWLPGWKAKGWRAAAGKPVKNRDLWERLDALAGERDVTFQWVKGHAGIAENERVDRLSDAQARKAAEEAGWTEASRFGFTSSAAD